MHDVTVADVMHPGIVTADPSSSIAELAISMADRRIHCLVVEDVGIVTDMDLLGALHSGSDVSAGQLAATEAMTVAEQIGLDEAVTLMVEHDLSHVIVVDEADGRPVGILSSLDVARAAAGGAAVQA